MIIEENFSNKDPYLSVVVITYNHERYIKNCLDSILAQNVDFPIEIIISDDCSTDNTQKIINDYHKKYPEIIKPNLRTVNVGASKNQYDCFTSAVGKYIAILDGDDFWTNNNKLKLQTDFLNKNDSYIGCTHRYSVVDQNDKTIQEEYFGPGRPESGEYKIEDFLNYIYYGHPGTLVFRNIFTEPKYNYSIIYEADRFVCDITLGLILTCLGRIYVLDENYASYRMVSIEGGTSYCSSIAKLNQIQTRIKFLKMLEQYCDDEMSVGIKHKDRTSYYVWWSILFMLRYPSKHNWISLKEVYVGSSNKLKILPYILIQLPKLPILLFNHLIKRFKINIRNSY